GVLGQGAEEVQAAGEAARAYALAAQDHQKGITDGGVVVDDEDGMEAHTGSTPSSRFRVKEKAAPPSALLETCSRPPWLSTMVRVTDRPRPMPPVLVVVSG